jgi:hypothetical protein
MVLRFLLDGAYNDDILGFEKLKNRYRAREGRISLEFYRAS